MAQACGSEDCALRQVSHMSSSSVSNNNSSSTDWQQGVAFVVVLAAILSLAGLRVACSIHAPSQAAASQSLNAANSLWLIRSGL
jgi:hypothetical protein